MRLCYSTTSPYVRKVSVCILELGLDARVEPVPTNPWDPETDLGSINPLGKVPTLVTDDGQVLFDSPVICEYLDSLVAEPTLYPTAGAPRWQALRLQALADGLLDASVSRFLELNKRAQDERSEMWLERQLVIMRRALDAMEAEVGSFSEAITIGAIATGCALGYVAFRFADLGWHEGRPALAAWYAGFSDRPSMQATVPQE